MPATLYLIPCWLEEQITAPLPPYLLDAIKQCTVFFVENERSARRYLKTLWKEMIIDNYEWHAIQKIEQQPEVIAAFRSALGGNKTIGLISEAGCPGVADPGQFLTAIAHEAGAITHPAAKSHSAGTPHQAGAIVRPLVGPSSILLALMASGLNGQQFRFSGYLPVDNAGRATAIKNLEAESARLQCTQLFIETPYRNNQLLETLLSTCRPSTRLCIAANLTAPTEYIRTLTITQWRQSPPPDLHKQPAIFALLA
jgi:16S rRNA (cytidine1402-2'-O)-methyltransferase